MGNRTGAPGCAQERARSPLIITSRIQRMACTLSLYNLRSLWCLRRFYSTVDLEPKLFSPFKEPRSQNARFDVLSNLRSQMSHGGICIAACRGRVHGLPLAIVPLSSALPLNLCASSSSVALGCFCSSDLSPPPGVQAHQMHPGFADMDKVARFFCRSQGTVRATVPISQACCNCVQNCVYFEVLPDLLGCPLPTIGPSFQELSGGTARLRQKLQRPQLTSPR